ncbi:MAG: hypothetical protein A2939_04535 [Parcubacteria group bacterium RIFCSPLOWO2_01_FULL_48_18]|nr:MAG: hypothetical protein A2939_04535 [Parcubacteria group bacterium RIFCSPLOWO2_01_FULL_48_18]
MAKPFLSVIIPAYNEEERLPITLLDIDAHLSKADFSYEIIVVNAASADRTLEVAKRFGEIIKNLKVISADKSRKGYAVQRGMLEAKGTYRLFTDADNSVSIDHFDSMLPHLKEGYGAVICSRSMKGSKLSPPQPLHKRLLGKMGNLVIQFTVLPGLWDTQCGFKAFSEQAATAIFSKIMIRGWGFDAEALALARRLGYRIKEIPVVWVNDPRSHVTFSGYLGTLWEVAKVRYNLWFNRYNISDKR